MQYSIYRIFLRFIIRICPLPIDTSWVIHLVRNNTTSIVTIVHQSLIGFMNLVVWVPSMHFERDACALSSVLNLHLKEELLVISH